MIIETAMRFAGQESGIDPENRAENILSIVKNLQRFVTPSHQVTSASHTPLFGKSSFLKKLGHFYISRFFSQL